MKRTCRSCGCRDDLPCPGGCYWLETDLCSSCANVHIDPRVDLEQLEDAVPLDLAAGTLLVLHGALCLAVNGPPELARRLPMTMLSQLLDELGELLVSLELITPEIRDEARRAVASAAPRIVLASG